MDRTKILFVCLGNICRSPSAEAVMNSLIKAKGIEELFEIDSAGITGYHAGEPADQRMQRHALNRDIHLTSISRQVKSPADFEHFDYIIGMDNQNIDDLYQLAPNEQLAKKISKMTDYCTRHQHDSVPDPYYGGAAGFELVLDLLEDACEGLLEHIQSHE
ncbi:low molecular weight phosphotyrosine protein phosphatase [Carboxylicivirga sediminis]|uniref:Low molecular weight phosphotyrosine protein phosphatase n=1 Tax=Carboxylicivirga sediminis TaxID=2006564 RepID=A0A941F405_9BACT|nr:low molecular weight protein-tyrosine-phosphatase [Carboxylicivirga sediminis]MBR8536346.1 low molecular weight phosphotyrosine protein phosphatase [Carboxylicivirga sediminis]